MNIISVRRALRACNNKVGALQKRRERVKDKPAWDKKYGDELALHTAHQVRLTGMLLGALAKQGQFDHSDWRNTEAAEREYYGK